MRKRFMNELMAEPIAMPGAPDLIVTRGQAYDFLKAEGYPLVGGFGSVDYMVFGRKPSDRVLSSDEERARYFAAMRQPLNAGIPLATEADA
jgi:hypothetical protein